MNDPYDEEDDYDDDYYDYDHPSNNKDHKWYFKFDVGVNNPISSWISDMLDELSLFSSAHVPNWPLKKFPVNSWNPNTANNKFQYLGSDYQGNKIWKTKHFLGFKYNQEYKSHLQHHAAHFVKQPPYYKGMFDILN